METLALDSTGHRHQGEAKHHLRHLLCFLANRHTYSGLRSRKSMDLDLICPDCSYSRRMPEGRVRRQ